MGKSVKTGDCSANFLGVVFAIIKKTTPLSLGRFGTLEFIFSGGAITRQLFWLALMGLYYLFHYSNSFCFILFQVAFYK